MKKHRSFIILAAVTLLLLLLSGAAAYYSYNRKNTDKIAYIYQDDNLLYTIDLNAVKDPYTIEISCEEGTNTVEVHSGKIGVVSADCPDKTCVKTGFIGNGMVPVICVPHGLMIVVRDESGGAVDAQV